MFWKFIGNRELKLTPTSLERKQKLKRVYTKSVAGKRLPYSEQFPNKVVFFAHKVKQKPRGKSSGTCSQCRVKFRVCPMNINGFFFCKKKTWKKKLSYVHRTCLKYFFTFFFSCKKNRLLSLHIGGFFFPIWELVSPHASPMSLHGVFK